MRIKPLLLPFFAFLFSVSLACAQTQIAAGPMPGYSAMLEVGVWLQLDGPGEVLLEYWPKDQPFAVRQTQAQRCVEKEAFTARIIATPLLPGTTYNYRVVIDGKPAVLEAKLEFQTQALWQHREDPPDFVMALGSCSYINETRFDRPGEPYGSEYGIFDQIAADAPDLMLWLGDHIYLREPDLDSWTGYMHRYSHTRQTPELQTLLQSTHHYAIWDDHDFGPNDADGSWVHKNWALDAFKLFWMNPSYGVNGQPGITGAFNHNDVHVFMLDNRYERTSQDTKAQDPFILGQDQIDWLIEALKFSKAKYKLVAVGGQVLSNAAVHENHAIFAKERQHLLDRIASEKIKGVIFLTGDRHHTELSKVEAENGIVMYDLTVSPLTSKAYDHSEEPNNNRMEGTIVGEHNYALLRFQGPWKTRTMTIEIYDQEGELLWTRTLPEDKEKD